MVIREIGEVWRIKWQDLLSGVLGLLGDLEKDVEVVKLRWTMLSSE
jgi:hypothetical protein